MINLEQYTGQLEDKSGYCNCEDLNKLFSLRKKTISLEKKCDYLKGRINLDDPASTNGKLLQDYEAAARGLKESGKDYHLELTHLINTGRLKLILHNQEKFHVEREIDFSDIKSEQLITAHCSICDQQIDLIEI